MNTNNNTNQQNNVYLVLDYVNCMTTGGYYSYSAAVSASNIQTSNHVKTMIVNVKTEDVGIWTTIYPVSSLS